MWTIIKKIQKIWRTLRYTINFSHTQTQTHTNTHTHTLCTHHSIYLILNCWLEVAEERRGLVPLGLAVLNRKSVELIVELSGQNGTGAIFVLGALVTWVKQISSLLLKLWTVWSEQFFISSKRFHKSAHQSTCAGRKLSCLFGLSSPSAPGRNLRWKTSRAGLRAPLSFRSWQSPKPEKTQATVTASERSYFWDSRRQNVFTSAQISSVTLYNNEPGSPVCCLRHSSSWTSLQVSVVESWQENLMKLWAEQQKTGNRYQKQQEKRKGKRPQRKSCCWKQSFSAQAVVVKVVSALDLVQTKLSAP